MKDHPRDCFADLGSVTYAMKAQKVLGDAAIPSSVIKLDTSSRHRGCTYGIRFSCQQRNNVQAVLQAAHISVKQWNKND